MIDDLLKPMKSALDKVMDYLAKRDYSTKELMTKLQNKYTDEEITDAITYAIQHGWILKPEELSKKVALRLDHKLRGILYINKYLTSKGLPTAKPDWDREFEKCRDLVERKLRFKSPYTIEQRQVIYRYLTYRGFTDDICRKVIYEK